MSRMKLLSSHEIETAARKHATMAGYEVERALRQLSRYPGGPPAIMQAERNLMDAKRLLNGVVQDLVNKGRAS